MISISSKTYYTITHKLPTLKTDLLTPFRISGIEYRVSGIFSNYLLDTRYSIPDTHIICNFVLPILFHLHEKD